MNTSVSNLCWSFNNDVAFQLLKDNEVRFVELSLTKHYGAWEHLNPSIVKQLSFRLKEDYNLSVSSLQSIFYQKNYNLFENQNEIIEHFKLIIEMCNILKCNYIVFGSPKMRKVGNRELSECDEIFLKIFDKVSDLDKSITVGIETNPRFYGCEYLTSYEDCVKVLNQLSKDNIKFHLDTACVFLADDDPIEIFEKEKQNLGVIHLSTKNLGLINTDSKLKDFIHHASKFNTNKIFSIEMLNTNPVDLLNCIKFVTTGR